MDLIRTLLFGKRARGNQRLLVDVRQVLGRRDQMPVTELLRALAERRPIYETWSAADLVEQLAALNVRVSGRGRARSVRSSDVEACDK